MKNNVHLSHSDIFQMDTIKSHFCTLNIPIHSSIFYIALVKWVENANSHLTSIMKNIKKRQTGCCSSQKLASWYSSFKFTKIVKFCEPVFDEHV